jgi:hypothetical protein
MTRQTDTTAIVNNWTTLSPQQKVRIIRDIHQSVATQEGKTLLEVQTSGDALLQNSLETILAGLTRDADITTIHGTYTTVKT